MKKLISQSLEPLSSIAIPADIRVLDVGSGAGIPGFPLKFALPQLRLTMLEPRRKKALFLQRVVDDLGLKDVEVLRARLEDISAEEKYRRQFDLITTRGTGAAAPLFLLMQPLVKKGGMCWFYKARSRWKEYRELQALIRQPVKIIPLQGHLNLICVHLEESPNEKASKTREH